MSEKDQPCIPCWESNTFLTDLSRSSEKKKSLFPPEQKNNALMRGIDLRGWNTALHSNVLN